MSRGRRSLLMRGFSSKNLLKNEKQAKSQGSYVDDKLFRFQDREDDLDVIVLDQQNEQELSSALQAFQLNNNDVPSLASSEFTGSSRSLQMNDSAFVDASSSFGNSSNSQLFGDDSMEFQGEELNDSVTTRSSRRPRRRPLMMSPNNRSRRSLMSPQSSRKSLMSPQTPSRRSLISPQSSRKSLPSPQTPRRSLMSPQNSQKTLMSPQSAYTNLSVSPGQSSEVEEDAGKRYRRTSKKGLRQVSSGNSLTRMSKNYNQVEDEQHQEEELQYAKLPLAAEKDIRMPTLSTFFNKSFAVLESLYDDCSAVAGSRAA